jgi:uncharacterized protein (UPF0548 family)
VLPEAAQVVLQRQHGGVTLAGRSGAGPADDGPQLGAARQLRAQRRIGSGRDRFDQAGDSVMRYGMLRGAGVRVTATTEVAKVGTDVLGHLGPFAAPCRVVYVVDEPNRRGFAYGSLPGHAVRGEELFAVRYDPADDGVYSEVAAFSRPATWWSRLGVPVLMLAQRVVTTRYLDAL